MQQVGWPKDSCYAAGQVAESLIVGLGILCRHQAELWHCTDLASDITLLTERKLSGVPSMQPLQW